MTELCQQVGIVPPEFVLTSKKLSSLLGRPEDQPELGNSNKVTYEFSCPETGCESRYIGVTSRHLFQRVKEHLSMGSSSAVRDHLTSHSINPSMDDHLCCFKILRKSSSWRQLLSCEAFLIKSRKSDLNKQADSIVLCIF